MRAETCFGLSQTILREHPETAKTNSVGVMTVLFTPVCCCCCCWVAGWWKVPHQLLVLEVQDSPLGWFVTKKYVEAYIVRK
jgi:hypothetical protein